MLEDVKVTVRPEGRRNWPGDEAIVGEAGLRGQGQSVYRGRASGRGEMRRRKRREQKQLESKLAMQAGSGHQGLGDRPNCFAFHLGCNGE